MAGKWKVAELTPTRVDTPDGSISVSWVNNFDGGVRERKAEAVARLIAAAPDLLEACKTMADELLALRQYIAEIYGQTQAAPCLRAESAEYQGRAAIARATQPLPPQSEDAPR